MEDQNQKGVYTLLGLVIVIATMRVRDANRRVKRMQKNVHAVAAQRDAIANYAFGTEDAKTRTDKLHNDLEFINMMLRME